MRRIAALLFLPLMAAAADAEWQIPPGHYEFVPELSPPPGYACRETWTIGTDGTLRFESGQQQSIMQIGYEDHWLAGRVLVVTPVSTNGLPDCNGNRRDPADHRVRRFDIGRLDDGTISLCHLPHFPEVRQIEDENGDPLPGMPAPQPGSCPGALRPVGR